MRLLVERVRLFNRFYTRYVGALEKEFLQTSFSLTEASVLYELAHEDNLTATLLGEKLSIDHGYLSRILRDFVKRGFVRKELSKTDARQSHLFITQRGRKAYETIDRRQNERVISALSHLSADDQHRLAEAMETIESLLKPPYR